MNGWCVVVADVWLVFRIPVDPSHQEVEASLDLGTVPKAINIQGVHRLAVGQRGIGSGAHWEDTNRDRVNKKNKQLRMRWF